MKIRNRYFRPCQLVQTRRAARVLVVALTLLLTTGTLALAQLSPDKKPSGNGFPVIAAPTLGGKQFWTDHLWRHGWRIQQNSITGHWRLIDQKNIRHAWGSRTACQKVLDSEVPDANFKEQEVVVLLHGLMRSGQSMHALGDALEQHHPSQIVYFEYASTRGSIAKHAVALREVIEGLPPGVSISFVGHSMGNIVVRHLIGDLQRDKDQAMLGRIKHVVMLGPPNQGSSIARELSKTGVFGWLVGKGGMELGPKWKELESKLAIPHCPFGIIAGKLPESIPQNPLVGGGGDFVVSVEETRLPGAADFLEVPCVHSILMDNQAVLDAVAEFLDHDHF